MEQRSEIARPRALRFRCLNASTPPQGLVRSSAGRHDSRADEAALIPVYNKSPDVYEQRQVLNVCVCSLETLASLGEDEDRSIMERAATESDLRRRSDSALNLRISKGETNDNSQVRLGHFSYPFAGNVLLAPERPENPMVRDLVFGFAGAREEVELGLSP